MFFPSRDREGAVFVPLPPPQMCQAGTKWLKSANRLRQMFSPVSIRSLSNGSRTAFRRLLNRRSLAGPRSARVTTYLISAPTGSGKTLSAFLICLDRSGTRGACRIYSNEHRRSSTSRRSRRSATTFIRTWKSRWPRSPDRRAETAFCSSPIRTAVRTGDTPASERQQWASSRRTFW